MLFKFGVQVSPLPTIDAETEQLDQVEKILYSAVLSDILDSMGYRNHAMNPEILPVLPEATLAGRAMPIELSASNREPSEKDPYGMLIDALDSLKPNEVVVLAGTRARQAAVWGELLSVASKARCARGAVVDGPIRDSRQILGMNNFPVFSVGRVPYDSKGRVDVVKHHSSIRSGDVIINPGDLVFADIDGVVIVPKEIEKEVLIEARKKVSGENTVRDELSSGKYLRQVWTEHGIL